MSPTFVNQRQLRNSCLYLRVGLLYPSKYKMSTVLDKYNRPSLLVLPEISYSAYSKIARAPHARYLRAAILPTHICTRTIHEFLASSNSILLPNLLDLGCEKLICFTDHSFLPGHSDVDECRFTSSSLVSQNQVTSKDPNPGRSLLSSTHWYYSPQHRAAA